MPRALTPTMRTRVLRPQLLGDAQDRLGVEDGVVPLEQLGDAGLVDLHLELADTDRADADDTVTDGAIVGGLDPLDPLRWHGIEVDREPQPGAVGPCRTWGELNAGGPRVEEDLCAGDALAGLLGGGQHADLYRATEAGRDAPAHALAIGDLP